MERSWKIHACFTPPYSERAIGKPTPLKHPCLGRFGSSKCVWCGKCVAGAAVRVASTLARPGDNETVVWQAGRRVDFV